MPKPELQRVITRVGLLALLVGSLGCTASPRQPASEEVQTVPSRSLSEVLKAHATDLMAIDGVTMVYEGELEDGRSCLVIAVQELDDALLERLPAQLEGYPVDVRESGTIRPLSDQ